MPDVVDLTSDGEDWKSLRPTPSAPLQSPPTSVRKTPSAAYPFAKSPASIPQNKLGATPTKGFSRFVTAPPKKPSTPTKQTTLPWRRIKTNSSDKNIPVSLRVKTDTVKDMTSIDPILRSPLSRFNAADSGLGESLPSSQTSTKGHQRRDRADLFMATKAEIPAALNLQPSEGINRNTPIAPFPQRRENNSRNLAIPSKRARPGNEYAKAPLAASLPISQSVELQRGGEYVPQAAAIDKSSDVGPGRSLTPHIPSIRKAQVKSHSSSSPRPDADQSSQVGTTSTASNRESRKPAASESSTTSLLAYAVASKATPISPYQSQHVAEQPLSAPKFGVADSGAPETAPWQRTGSPNSASTMDTKTSVIRQAVASSYVQPTPQKTFATTTIQHKHPLASQNHSQIASPSASTHTVHSCEHEIDMQFDSTENTPWASDFDRGRYPKERRRRGGKKYGTPRAGAYSKKPRVDAQSHHVGGQSSYRVNPKPSESHEYHQSPATVEEVPRPPKHLAATVSKTLNKDQVGNWTLPRTVSSSPANLPKTRIVSLMMMTDAQDARPEAARHVLVGSPEESQKVANFFVKTLAPALKRLGKIYAQFEDVNLDELGKSISNDLISEELLRFLRANDFTTDKFQRKNIRKQIGRLYYQKLLADQQFIRDNVRSSATLPAAIDWALIPQKGRVEEVNDRSPSSILVIDASDREVHGPYLANTSSGQGENRQTRSPPSSPGILHKRDNNGVFRSNLRLIDTRSPSSPAIRKIEEKSIDSFSRKPANLRLSSQQQLPVPRFPRLANMGRRRSRNTAQHETPMSSTSNHIQQALQYKSYAVPNTVSDPELEYIIAKAALKMSSIHEIDTRPSVIVRNDQDQLRGQTYVAKSLDQQARRLTTIKSRVLDPASRPGRGMPALLRHRELSGGQSGLRSDLGQRVVEQIRPWRKWKGASSDITAVAWSPDSSTYVVGAAAHTNAEDLQYNRPCNLMLGELTSNKLWELPDHRTKRPTPETILQGPNSSQQTYNSCDPMIYQTIHATSFSSDGHHMYTASRDNTVKVWDVSGSQRACIKTIDHGAVVTGLSVSSSPRVRVFATACQSVRDAIRVFWWSNDQLDPVAVVFSSSKAILRDQKSDHVKIFPECLAWGASVHNHHQLLAGFSQWDGLQPGDFAREGQLCLWDIDTRQSIKITPSSSSVTAVTWHPFLPYFASGGAPGKAIKKHATKTVVRTYDPRSLTRTAMEYECPAHDILDVTFHPLDHNIATAGCTDGTSFVWDYRWPDQPLHLLHHGDALMELDPRRSRAETDTGVSMSSWDLEGSLYYTGSSDGFVKAWDIRRHPVDVHVRDVAQVGAAIQNGAFSPDFSHLLVGDADGAIHILSSAPCSSPLGDDSDDGDCEEEIIQLIRAPDGSGKRVNPDDDQTGTEGIEAAKKLVDTHQLEVHQIYGPLQGPNYRGPYAVDRRFLLPDGSLAGLQSHVDQEQIIDSQGNVNEKVAAHRKAHHDRRTWEFNARRAANVSHSFMESAEEYKSAPIPRSVNCNKTLDGEAISDLPIGAKPYRVIDFQAERDDMNRVLEARHLSQSAALESYLEANRMDALPSPHDGKMNGVPIPRSHSKDITAAPHMLNKPRSPNEFNANRLPEKKVLKWFVNEKIREGKMLEENFWWPDLGAAEIQRAIARCS